jgi:hypothetical protein
MTRISLANDAAGILNAFGPGGQARAKPQLAAMADALRQLIGDANIAFGSSESTDPLTAPFVLYVNPYIGRDTFAAGSYNTKEAASGSTTEQVVAQKLKRLEDQRLTCGYTRHAPFKTINRAIIEAAIITSKNWYINDPLAHVDCVCIVLAPGLHIVYNNPAADGSAVSTWTDGFEPTAAQLIGFNPTEGGVMLPRGSSIVSEFGDLRHTIVRPNWVPNGDVDEAPTYLNGVATYALRRQIFKTTGGGYAYGLTAMDKLGLASSHHLLAMFGHATKAELDTFYANVFTACGSGGNLSQALLAARGTEYTIAAPISGTPTEAWDSTASASFYIFQCSIRSNYGLGRLWNDGSKVLGFRSFVCANFTGVSLQKSISEQGDMRCWQKYSGGNWVAVSNYQDYISQAPDNIRMNPARRSVGIGAINKGFVQKVSIFDIGEGAQSFVDTGGEIDSNGGNSSFGGCAGLAKGYRDAAFPNDRNWQISAIKVPLSPEFKTGNIQRFYLGTVAAFTSSSVTLSTGLAAYGSSSTVPDMLGRSGYSLPSGSYLWVENPQGTDWRAPLTSSAWSSVTPAQINISAAITDPSGGAVGVGGNGVSLAIGARVYVRRLVDIRTPAERRLSIKLSNTTSARIPSASAVLQVDATSSAIARTLSASSELLLVTATGVGDTPGAGVIKTAEVTLRRGGTPITYANGTTYRAGTVVLHANKHYTNSKELTTTNSVPDPTLWQETYVHMESTFAPEDNLKNEGPILIFDTDTDGAEATTTCGIVWSTVWTAAGSVTNQYRTGTDYLGAFLLLSALGYGASDAHAALVPRAEASRSRNPALTSNPVTTLALSSTSPTGGAANAAVNWPVEFRRPSTLWMGGHRWFGSGAGNYSKAVLAAAQDMSAQNRFSYYFTSQGGGRVIPQGSQEDGLLVSPRGLEDTTTGQTLSVEDIGAGDINTSQGTSYPTLSVGDLTVSGSTNLSGPIVFNDSQVSQTTRLGPVKLAPLAELIKTGSAASVATADASINGEPGAVTLPGLNAWKNANQLVSALTGEIYIYVNSTAPDRDLNSLKARPPVTPADAVPSLGRAAEYANYVLAGSDQTAVIRTAPGYYYSSSYWKCNVRLESWNSTFTAMPFPSNNLGTATTPNNYYDGTGYDNAALIPQIISWRLLVRPGGESGATAGATNLHILLYPTTMYLERSVKFVGGFAFLGLAETIKYVSGNPSQRAASFVISSEPGLSSAAQISGLNYSSDVSSNVDNLLSSIRTATNYTGFFAVLVYESVLEFRSRLSDSIVLSDCIFGPGLPSHKESLNAPRHAYINVMTEAPLFIKNIYLRGNTTITSQGIGCTNPLELSGDFHYGATTKIAPWTFKQFHHTFISTMSINKINIKALGANNLSDSQVTVVRRADAGTVGGFDNDWYADLTGKLLPNHIHLLTNSSTATAPNTFTPAAGLAYPATTPSIDNDSGPFLDQFIHAKYGISFDYAWIQFYSQNTARPVFQGFLGRFGSNGFNAVKTRGVLVGNSFGETEGSFEVTPGDGWWAGSPFVKAGIVDNPIGASSPPFVQGSASFGEANPAVKTLATRVITARDNGSTTLDLNLGLVNWVKGISPEYGTTIRRNLVS